MAVVVLLLVFITLGYATVALLLGTESISTALIAGLSILLGSSECALLLFYFALLSLPPGLDALYLVAAVAIGLLSLAMALGRCRLPSFGNSLQSSSAERGWLMVPLVQTVFGFVVVTVGAVRMPLYEWDARAFWLFKAKIIANEQLIPPPLFLIAPPYAYAHPQYPLLWPVLAAAANGSLSGWSDHASRLIEVPIYLALALVIYSTLRKDLHRFSAAMLASLLLVLPTVLFFASTGIADVTFTSYYAGMVCCILLYSQRQDWPSLICAAMLAAACAFTKIEGMPIVIIGALMVLLLSALPWPASIARSFLFVTIALILLAPWYVWSHGFSRLDEDYQLRLSSAVFRANLVRIPVIFSSFLREFINFSDWGLFWIVLPIGAALGRHAFVSRRVQVLWAALVAHFSIYVFAFFITHYDLAWQLKNSVSRLLIHLSPIAILLLGYHWEAVESAAGAE